MPDPSNLAVIQGMQSPQLTDKTFRDIADWIERECGICLNDTKKYLVQTRFAPVMAHLKCDSFDAFYTAVCRSTDKSLRARIIDAITTNETLWFRDASVWKYIEETLVHRLAERTGQRVRIWSAACSTGQEIYSLNMLVDQLSKQSSQLRTLQNRMESVATDISPNVINVAQRGRYSRLEMSRGLPPEYKANYFAADRMFSTLTERIRNRVKFSQLNLQDSFSHLGLFDVILCRNVTIYFSKEFRQDLLDRLERSLKPGGLLILGASESLLGYRTSLKRLPDGPACIYTKEQ